MLRVISDTARRFSGTSRRWGPVLGRLALVLLLLGGAFASVRLVKGASAPVHAPMAAVLPQAPVEAAPVRPGSAAPGGSVQPGGGADAPVTPTRNPLQGWADRVATVVDVPSRALLAYANADLSARQHDPECHLSWATLAGLARVESNHGRYGGGTLRADGRPSRPVVGVPLNGAPGMRSIPDTDHGRLDGDRVHDRATGPFQFIPSTWRKWSTDGNGDGLGDPQNIDDAAATAARYLCADGRDLATGTDWWQAVMSYNNSVEYAQKVFGLAERYSRASREARE